MWRNGTGLALYWPGPRSDGVKKLIWSVLVTVTSIASATVAVRLLGRAWEGLLHEPPPKTSRWTRLFIGKPVKPETARQGLLSF